jgi:hypothetical protein
MKETDTQRDAHTDPRYEQVREAFAKLETQDKAAFVLEATFDTFGQALRDVGQTVGDAVEKMGKEDFFDDLFRRRPETTPGAAEAASGSGPAEPPSSASRPSGTRKTGPASRSTPPDEGTPPVA